MAEISSLQRLANALKEYKGSKAAAYVDALPEMVASSASGMAAAVPAAVEALRGDGPLTERAQRFKDTQSDLSFDPSIDQLVLSEVSGAIPEVVKDASAGYDAWAKDHPILSLAPGMVAGSLRGLKPMVEWKQLEGHPQEAEIRAGGRMPIPGSDSWVHWRPSTVNEKGIPSAFTVKSGITKAIPGQGNADDYTSFSVHDRGGDFPLAMVGGSYNNLSGPGSGGLKRYEDAMSLLFPNQIGMASSSMNTPYSTAAWNKLASNMNEMERAGVTPPAVPFRRTDHIRQGFEPAGNEFTGAYLQNTGRKSNWLMLPESMAARLRDPATGYAKNAGLARSATGQRPNVAATYSQMPKRTATDRVTGGSNPKVIYGSADDVMAADAAGTQRVNVSEHRRDQFARGVRHDADNRARDEARARSGANRTEEFRDRGVAEYLDTPDYVRALQQLPEGQVAPAYSLSASRQAAAPAPAPAALPTMEVADVSADEIAALRGRLAGAAEVKQGLRDENVRLAGALDTAGSQKRTARLQSDINESVARRALERESSMSDRKSVLAQRKAALARRLEREQSRLRESSGSRSDAEALRMKNAFLVEMLRGR